MTKTHPYEPDDRFVDNRRRLAKLRHEKGLSINQITDHEDCKVSKSTVYKALLDFGIIRKESEKDEYNCEQNNDDQIKKTTAAGELEKRNSYDTNEGNRKLASPMNQDKKDRGHDPPTFNTVDWTDYQ